MLKKLIISSAYPRIVHGGWTMTISISHVILLSLAVVLGFAFAAQGDLADQDHRNVPVNCSAAINKESIDLFRKLESTTRLVYFTEENEGVDLVWAYSHAEPFFSLEEDFMRFAIVISKHLVVHINVDISINNCTLLNKTSTRYTAVVVEMFASTLLIDVAELVGTVCYKTTKGKQQSYHCCRPARDESGKFTTVLCDLQERSIIWLKVLKVLIVVVVVILGYVYVPILTSRIFSHPPSRKDTRPIELTSNDLEDCFYVYFQPCRTDCLHRVGQFLYGFCLVPFVVYVSLALYFTFDWPKFVSVFLEPYSLFCFTCYCLREALNFLPLEASEENAQHECLICRLWDEKPGDSSETITEQLKLLPRRIGKAGECIYKTFRKCTVLSIPRECTMEYLWRFLLFLPLAFVCFAWFLLSVPSCILLAFPAYSSVREGRYWWPLSHHKMFYADKSVTLKSIFVGVLEFFLNICACAGYVIIGSITAYFLVHVSVYVIMLLTLDFDFLTYVVCLFLVVFYISYSVRSLAEKYGRLKLVIFECYKPSTEEDGSAVSDNGNYDGGDQDDEESIPGDLYLEVCKEVEPKFKNLFMMLLNLVIFLTFVFVVTACVIIFGPRPGGASGLVRSLIALLLGLSPKVTNMFSPSETDQEKEYLKIKNRVKKQVQLYLQKQDTKASEEGPDSFLSRRSKASLEYPHDWIELA